MSVLRFGYCENWWPIVERFLQATGIKPLSWHETTPEQIERGIAEVERNKAIVDKLPKCWRLNEQGELVQDEPILSGMNVITICKTNTEEVGVLSVEACEDCGFDIVIRDGGGDEWYLKEEELYLTREAAEAAKKV